MATALKPTLPIAGYAQQIVAAISDNSVTIIQAETGAGKSTQVPQFLLELGFRVIVTQPRRLAARTLAKRVADERDEKLGGVIGFRTAHEREDSKDTRCLFVTDGLQLVRELVGSNQRDVLIIDEVHEWNLNIEVLLAWAKLEIERGAKFKLVVMSATLETDKISAYFSGAPVISVPGRCFPVKEQPPKYDIESSVLDLLQSGSRRILVFQPGKSEIAQTLDALEETAGRRLVLLPLHGELSPDEQQNCFRDYPVQVVIVATNVAQTSVTIPGVDAVVDSGLERRVELMDGVEGLYVKPISLADREQRKGRAGRTGPGIYIDHCKEFDRPAFPVAEIHRVRLDQTVLRLAEAGIDAEALEFFHQPDRAAIHAAKESLHALGCMDKSGAVTAKGRKISRFPCSVQIGCMLYEADKRGVVNDVLTIAALMEVGGILDRQNTLWSRHTGEERESDALAQLRVFEAARLAVREEREKDRDERIRDTELLRKMGIHAKNYFRAREMRALLYERLEGRVQRFSSTEEREDILKSVCAGQVEHLYQQAYSEHYQNGEHLPRRIGRESVVKWPAPQWIVGKPFDLQLKDRYTGGPGVTLYLITWVTKVDPDWLVEIAPHLVREEGRHSPSYNPELDVVQSVRRIMFRDQVIGEQVLDDPNHPQAAEVFASWLAEQMYPTEVRYVDTSYPSWATRRELRW